MAIIHDEVNTEYRSPSALISPRKKIHLKYHPILSDFDVPPKNGNSMAFYLGQYCMYLFPMLPLI